MDQSITEGYPKLENGAKSGPESGQLSGLIVVVSSTLAVISVVIVAFVVIKILHKRRQKRLELSEMTPGVKLANKYSENTIGVRYKQPIKFALPAITVENSEPNVTTCDSDTDNELSLIRKSSSGASLTSKNSQQRISSMERYQISADEIEPELYMSDSTESCNLRNSGLGKVGFSLQYSMIRHQLYVKIIGATGLPTQFLQKGSASPFVKLVLHPEKNPKYLTKVHRNTNNPVFQEMFVFPAKFDDIESRILRIGVWDYDKFSRKVPIGGISVPLKEFGIDYSLKEDLITEDVWRELSTNGMERQSRGDLMFSLSFKPETSTITVVIIKIKNLQWSEVQGEKEYVYIKIRLLDGKKLIKSRKTQAIRKRTIPEFDYNFSQYVSPAIINDLVIELYVYIKSGFSGKRLIGRTQVGNNQDVPDQGVHHWTDMIDAPRSTVAQWHSIF